MAIIANARLSFQSLMRFRPDRKWLWILLILLSGLALRYLFVFRFHPPEKYIYSDMEGYFDRAYRIHAGMEEDIYSSFYPPGTHFVYSIFFNSDNVFLWIKWFNILLSTLTCLVVYHITNRLFGNKAGMYGLMLCSFDYIFIDFTGYILSETLYIFFLALMFWFLIESILSGHIVRKRIFAILAGFAIIASASFKSSILLFLPLFAIWWLLNFKRYRLLFNLPFYALGFLPLCFLLVIRFYSLTGEFGIVSSNGGFNFYQGRSHVKDLAASDLERGTFYSFASPVAVEKNYDRNELFYAGPYDSDFFYRKGFELIRKEPGRAIKYSLQHISDLFITADIWPSWAVDRPFPWLIRFFNLFCFIVIILPAFFIVAIRFTTLWNSVALLTLFPIIVIILTSAIYYGDPRFRVPYDVFFIMLAAAFYEYLPGMRLCKNRFLGNN